MAPARQLWCRVKNGVVIFFKFQFWTKLEISWPGSSPNQMIKICQIAMFLDSRSFVVKQHTAN